MSGVVTANRVGSALVLIDGLIELLEIVRIPLAERGRCERRIANLIADLVAHLVDVQNRSVR